MIKSRLDFKSESEFLKYTRSNLFLEEYKVNGKTANEIIVEMGLELEWMPAVEEALAIVEGKEKTSGLEFHLLLDECLSKYDEDEISPEELKKAEAAYSRREPKYE